MTVPDSPDSNARASFRVNYPHGYPSRLRPRVVVEPGVVAVLQDWSETGLRIRLPELPTQVPEEVIHLTITRRGHEPHSVDGKVVWVRNLTLAVHLEPPGLPYKLLLDEQRAILGWQAERAESR